MRGLATGIHAGLGGAMVAAGGGGLALVAMLEKAWRNNKDEIIDEIEDFVEEKTGLDIELVF